MAEFQELGRGRMLPLREFPTRIQRAWCLPLVLGAALVLPAAEADAQERPSVEQQADREQEPQPQRKPRPRAEPEPLGEPREQPNNARVQPAARAQPGLEPSGAQPIDEVVGQYGDPGLTPLYLAGVWLRDPITNQVANAAFQGGTEWSWPLVYDLHPSTVNLVWTAEPALEGTLAALGSGSRTGATLELAINNMKLAPTTEYLNSQTTEPPCPPARTCLLTKVSGAEWFRSSAPWWLELAIRQPVRHPGILGDPELAVNRGPTDARANPYLLGGPGEPSQEDEAITTKARVVRVGQAKSYFAEQIYPAFQHDRCTACHALGSVSALEARHAPVDWDGPGNGKVGDQPISVQQTGHGSVVTCGGGCHTAVSYSVPGETFSEVEWKAPGLDMSIDWRGKSAKYVCQRVVARLPTLVALLTHFHEDARIAWAVHSGKLPPMGPHGGQKLPLSPPGSYPAWVALTSGWIWHGFPCPH